MAKSVTGICRICGTNSVLTLEHILPRAAGGGERTKIYTGDELIKAATRRNDVADEDDDRPYGIIQQYGFASYTLCQACNNHSGKYYDKDFAQLYNAVKYLIQQRINNQDFTTIEELDAYFADKGMSLKLRRLKPNNIAKRVLVAFCSIDHAGLTDRKPEIRKAIMQKDYKPNTDSFSIYMTPHVGGNGYFGTLASISIDGGVHAYAGLELGPLAFYLAEHNAHLQGGPLARCVDITNWLTDYEYDEEVGELEIHANFEKSFALNIPNWAFE